MSGFWKPGASVPGGGERGDESVQLINHNLSHLPLDAQRRSLPIFRHKNSILYALKTHRTIVIVGETGCGKTTQVSAVYGIMVPTRVVPHCHPPCRPLVQSICHI